MKDIEYIDRPNSFPSPYIGICISEKAFKKELKRLKVPDDVPWIKTPQADATLHWLVKEGRLTGIVCLRVRKGIEHNQIVSLLVHESVHIWQEIRTSIGELNPSAEFEAYTIQHFSQKLIYAYDSLTKKRKRRKAGD